MILEYRFDIYSKVKVPGFKDTLGKIMFISFDGYRLEYKVRYLSNGEFKEAWFHEREVEEANGQM